jgi:hypothetical protein
MVRILLEWVPKSFGPRIADSIGCPDEIRQ